jgi:hypothetical protein
LVLTKTITKNKKQKMSNINIVNGGFTLDGNPIGGDEWTGGTQYILVKAEGTDIENAQELQDAYDLAKTMSPAIDNRITVIASPGNYNFSASTFTMHTNNINLVSLDGNRSIIFNSSDNEGTIHVSANDALVRGIDTLFKQFRVGNNLNLLRVENCKGGNQSFFLPTSPGTNTGTYINCQGGAGSFGGSSNVDANGSYIDCLVTGTGGFGSAIDAIASGTFTNCTAGNNSFGYNGIASGTFTNCIGGQNSFGGGNSGTLTGQLYRCQLTDGTFETPTGSGKIVLGIDGDDDVINLPV